MAIQKGSSVYYHDLNDKQWKKGKVNYVEKIKGKKEQQRIGAKAYIGVHLENGEKRWGYPHQFKKR